MLIELHVKNLALIERADLEFDNGLTILSGETGAGKSILIDSINVALGAKVGKGIIRNGAEYAYIELVFAVCDPEKIEKIRQMEIEVEDNVLLIITRKITPVKSVANFQVAILMISSTTHVSLRVWERRKTKQTSPSGRKHSLSTSCAGRVRGATVSRDGTVNVRRWEGNTSETISTSTAEEWILCSRIMNAK